MKPQIIFPKIMKPGACCFLLIVFNCIETNAQMTKLRPNVYTNYIKTDATVKVQTVEGQKVEATETTRANNIMIDAGKKSIVKYPGNIALLEAASLNKFRDDAKTNAPVDEVKVLPELHVEPTNGNESSEPTTYRIVFTSQQPLRYDETLKKFTARLAFLLMNQSGASVAPSEPVKIEINSDEISSIKPGSFEITHLSIPSTNVELIADHVTDSARVKVITVSNPDGYITYLKVKPLLDISSNRTTIQGWGIQEVPITVRFIGSNSTDTVKVTFSSEKGTVTPNPLIMRYNETATVHVRSEGMGNSKLTATATSIRSNDLTLNFSFPLYFLLATIAGGLAGSYIRNYSKSGKKKITAKFLTVGIVTGIIGAAAYYVLGVNLLGLSFSAGFNEMAVFAISALFAYFGIALLKPGSSE
jgi:hypothetical protein